MMLFNHNLIFEFIKQSAGVMTEITYFAAWVAGLMSFLSPCVLPIVPFYISYLAGSSVSDLSAGPHVPVSVRRRAVVMAVWFSVGMITVFVALGASASAVGQAMNQYFDLLRWGAALLIGAMGCHFLGIVRIPILNRQFQMEANTQAASSWFGAYVIGFAFAFGWTPCVGPVLSAILFVAAGQETSLQGAGLLFVYGVGMTAPFVLAAIFVAPFMRAMVRFRSALPYIEKAMGAMLIVFAVLIATNGVSAIAQWMLEVMPVFVRLS